MLVVTAGIAAAGYPEDYFGPPVPDGCMEIEAYVPSGWFLDRNPWSMPSPEEGILWFGTLCVEDGIAVLEFTSLAGRHCRESPWGTIDDPEVCYAWHMLDISNPDRHVMPWDPDFDPDWGFYLASVHAGEWIWFYESLTDNGDGSMTFVEGAFEFITPLWYVESDNYTRWKFLVTERETRMFGRRTTTGRRVSR
jgi:hypothetical protein